MVFSLRWLVPGLGHLKGRAETVDWSTYMWSFHMACVAHIMATGFERECPEKE